MTQLRRSLVGASLAACALACAWSQVPPAAPSITIGAEDDAAPWSYADGTGYVNDLVREAFRASGWTVHYSVLPYARCKRLAQYGELAGCFSASKTPQTEKELQFPATPVFAARNRLLSLSDSPLQGCNRTRWGTAPLGVALVHGYEYLPAVDALRASAGVRVETPLSEASALRMLRARRIDFALITTDAIKHIDYVAKLAGVKPDFKEVCNYGELPAYIAFSRKHPRARAAMQAFDQGMAELKRTGAMARLQKDWAARALSAAQPEPFN